MIKSPDVSSSDVKVSSCTLSSWGNHLSTETEACYDHVIPGSELDVAEEMEVVTEATENACEEINSCIKIPLTPQLLLFLQQLRPQLRLPDALQHQLPQTVTDCVVDEIIPANEDSQSNAGDLSCSDFDSISTLSVCDDDTNDLEEAMSLVDDHEITQMLSSVETGMDGSFDFVFNFCDEVLSAGVKRSSLGNAGCTVPNFIGCRTDDARSLLSSSSSGVSSRSWQPELGPVGRNGSLIEDSQSTGSEVCRKSARIAEKQKRNITRRRSDETSSFEDSENGDDDLKSFTPNRTSSKSCFSANHRNRSYSDRNQDEEFVVGGKKLATRKRRRSKSWQTWKEPIKNDFDILRELKQEKNRLAARRCRMKQKLLIDKLATEAADLQKEGDDLKVEIGDLQSELMTLQCFLVHHDALITSPTTTGLHCPIGAAIPPSLSETSLS